MIDLFTGVACKAECDRRMPPATPLNTVDQSAAFPWPQIASKVPRDQWKDFDHVRGANAVFFWKIGTKWRAATRMKMTDCFNAEVTIGIDRLITHVTVLKNRFGPRDLASVPDA